ncbi:MAG: hypothetical protein H7Z16_14125 [Pyrinomonadaceae bacterium]|nr:hypothetical protein [Pyrinomonadaceae bacterium]
MKLRELLIATAIMSFTLVSASAFKLPVPSPLVTEDKIIGSAYHDTLNILSTTNECSDFFGGPSISVDVFNDLLGSVRKDYLPASIGIQMSGATTNVSSMKTRSKYRLFEKVSINANGPFYRRRHSETQPTIPRVGTFQPNTREARVLMFLHELGHVVQADGKWLLPDDGRDEGLSRRNTRKIEDVCGDEIRNLGKGNIAPTSVTRDDVR